MLGEKLRISYPIFFVLSGLIVSLIPGIPLIEISSDMDFPYFSSSFALRGYLGFFYGKIFENGSRPILFLASGLVFLHH
ncbi:hypothetical protein [Bacteroidetes bacterium endosymbiont of Geopemphigus sp.]|uniref:hypothetical protein n=1 Tax=Bacteroidetes bacterium endosymbiont of Geopemphigus sp. TaxID=2047937 RepID=UPI000CD30762|nr:hypothetical protein [Bacteroidetes bacterium endosymbiont of Geopemphigus sp.]